MDFVEGLPTSNNKDMMLVVVDKFTKCNHFIPVKHPITFSTIARAFTDNIFGLNGLPSMIVTDRDMIFTSRLWQDLFKKLCIKVYINTSHHPHSLMAKLKG